jgi:hypothetical protein
MIISVFANMPSKAEIKRRCNNGICERKRKENKISLFSRLWKSSRYMNNKIDECTRYIQISHMHGNKSIV